MIGATFSLPVELGESDWLFEFMELGTTLCLSEVAFEADPDELVELHAVNPTPNNRARTADRALQIDKRSRWFISSIVLYSVSIDNGDSYIYASEMRLGQIAINKQNRSVQTGVLVAIMVCVLAACSTSMSSSKHAVPTTRRKASTSTQGSKRAPTAWDAIKTHIGVDGRLDLQGTRLAFALLFHPLPGVTPPSGALTSDERSNGSFIARSVLSHWNELSVTDRKIMAPYFDVSDTNSTAAATSVPPDTSSHRGRSVSPSPLSPAEQAQLSWASDQVWEIAMNEAKRFGFDYTSQGFFQLRFSNVEARDKKTGKLSGANAWTVVVGDKYVLNPYDQVALTTESAANCLIFLPPSTWHTLPSSGAPSPIFTEQLAHEVFHCFQGDIIGRYALALYEDAPSWVIEGGAAWAGADYAQSNKGYEAWYGDWLVAPWDQLFIRSYDAIGFYSTLQRLGALDWPKWRTIFEAMRHDSDIKSDFIYKQLTDNVDGLGAAWAPAYSRHADWGPDWDQAGFDVGKWKPSVVDEVMEDGSHRTLEANAYAAGLLDLSASTPVIVTVAPAFPTIGNGDPQGGTGVIRLHDEGSYDEVAKPTATFCMGGSCSCVTAQGSPAPVGVDTTGVVRVAVTGLEKGQSVRITAKANKKHCVPPTTQSPGGANSAANTPGGASCQGNCGASNGDPHLTTINGYHYDMQGAGEFVMLRSKSGFEVQTRDVPPSRQGPKAVTFNSAVAMRINGTRITVGMDASKYHLPVVRANGQQVKKANAHRGRVTITQDALATVTVSAPGQPKVVVRPLSRWGLHLFVDVPKNMAAGMSGLLASTQGQRLATRDGDLIDLSSDGSANGDHALGDRLYQRLAESWRVTSSESLFDYQPGQSTATFTDRSVPDLSVAQPTAAQLSAGKTVCEKITPNWLRDECAYDVAVTGDHSIADGYSPLVPSSTTTPGQPAAKTLHPGDEIAPAPLVGKRTYRLVTTKAGYFDMTPAIGCTSPPNSHVLTIYPDGTKNVTRGLCNSIEGMGGKTRGTYTIVFDTGGHRVSGFGLSVSPLRPKQYP